MNRPEKVEELKRVIERELLPLIGSDYLLLDLPYYENVGDLLIWQGTLEFLKRVPHKMLGAYSAGTFPMRPISPDTTILLQGGGNFGDLWRWAQDFRLKVIAAYPNNPIVILPQTVHYFDKDLLRQDARLFSEHKNITICARDSVSEGILNEYFSSNKVLLVPDMAMWIDREWLGGMAVEAQKKTLVLKRTDQELAARDITVEATYPQTVADWPTFDMTTPENKMLKYAKKFHYNGFSWVYDLYAKRYYKKNSIRRGVRFISSFEEVYTTRLHVMILCLLLDREVNVLDNSYGKNSSFVEAWLQDVEGLTYIK